MRRSALAEAVSGALTPRKKPFGALLITNPVSSPPPGMYVKERKKTDNPREGWEDGTPPPHRDFKERGVVH